jgi:NADH:ubiquinone oxidoreductase subunit 3 (subunit A)
MVAPAFAALVEYADGRLAPPSDPGPRVHPTIRMTSEYLTNWLYAWAFIVSGAALVVLILLFSKIINPQHLTPEKLAHYECGIPPVGSPWAPFAVRYYVFALLFLVFDVEAVFLFPWTLVFRTLGTAGFVEMVLFVVVLAWGLLYAWRKGALEWA